MYERILVPLDGSGLAESVLTHVEEIAAKFGARVLLLQVVPSFAEVMAQTTAFTPTTGAGISPTIAEYSMDIARERHGAEATSARTYLGGVAERFSAKGIQVETNVVEGSAADAILDSARASDVGLVAMSTHGRGGLGRLVFGSVADEVLRRSHFPLLLVRPSG